MLFALAGVYFTFAPVIKAEFFYRKDQVQNKKYIVAGDQIGSLPAGRQVNLLKIEKPLEISPISTDFGLVIPKINANAVVVSNVDAGDKKAYLTALKTGVAHALGTALPGEVGNTYLFAHSVGNFWEINQWNAVFYLLRELVPGDEVDIFYKNKRYIYVVYDKKILEPNETGYLEAITDFPRLTLQTCWPPGTTLKRLLVFARLKNQ